MNMRPWWEIPTKDTFNVPKKKGIEMEFKIMFVIAGAIFTIGCIEILKFLILHMFGKKYSVELTTKDGNDYNYGITAWSEDGAIIKALENYRYDINKDMPTKRLKILSINAIKVIKLK